MQIKYLKDAPLGQAGDIHDVPDADARVLIILGYAEPYDNKPKRKTKTTTENNTELDLS